MFGLGSRIYPQFCAFAHAVDRKFAALGALRVSPTGEGDELNGQDEAFSSWACIAFKVVSCHCFSVDENNRMCEKLVNDKVYDSILRQGCVQGV